MPPKIRDLISELEKAGFTNVGGKGSHRNYVHTKRRGRVTISGRLGDDAQPYQVKQVNAAIEGIEIVKDADRYAKIVQWSDEDGCFVGTIPDLCHGGCHGPDPKAVFDELCQIAEEWIEIIKADGAPLPVPTNFVASGEEGRTDAPAQPRKKSTGKLISRP